MSRAREILQYAVRHGLSDELTGEALAPLGGIETIPTYARQIYGAETGIDRVTQHEIVANLQQPEVATDETPELIRE